MRESPPAFAAHFSQRTDRIPVPGLAKRLEEPQGIAAHAEILVGIGPQHHEVGRFGVQLAALIEKGDRLAIAPGAETADGAIAENGDLQLGPAALIERLSAEFQEAKTQLYDRHGH